jgi:colanic acid/amylovoran biosynthesis protein
MKILITNVYSQDNKGDAAILAVMVEQIQKHFKGGKVYASVFEGIHRTKWSEDAKRIESFLYLISQVKNPLIQLTYGIYLMATTILWSLIFRLSNKKTNFMLPKRAQRVIEHFASADLIMPIGGGYLNRKNSLRETLVLLLALHPIYIAKLLKKPTVLYSQSLGPYDNKWQAIIARHVLNKVDLIIVREDISLKVLERIGVNRSIVAKSIDAGFLFSTSLKLPMSKELGIEDKLLKKPLIGITVRKWLEEKKQQKYEREIAKLCDFIISDYDASIIFIPQVTADSLDDDDREISQRIISKMRCKEHAWNLTRKYSHYEIKALYTNLDYLIGTRFHSVIFSLTSRVPAIAIEYEHKTGGIMQDLQLSEWVVKIEDVNAKKLRSKFHDLVNRRKEYLLTLEKSLKSYIRTARSTMLLVKQKYHEVQKEKRTNTVIRKGEQLAWKAFTAILLAVVCMGFFLFSPKNHIANNLKESFDFSNKQYRGTTADMSQILPDSDMYIKNSKGEDLIDIASRLGVNIFRITNIASSKKDSETTHYTNAQWQQVLGKMHDKGIDAIILVEANGSNAAYHNTEIDEAYIPFVRQYIIEPNVCIFPNVLAIDIRNEPVINENNLSKLREASRMIKSSCPESNITVGSWRTDSGEKYLNGEKMYYWHDPEIAPQLYDIVDIYSIHLYSFDIPVGNEFPDPYKKTVSHIKEVRKHTGGKPIIVTEFGSGNGSTITDQGTLGSQELQKEVYEGVFKAVKDLRGKNVLGAISYVFHTRHDTKPDGWNIIKDNGDTLLPAAYTFNEPTD